MTKRIVAVAALSAAIGALVGALVAVTVSNRLAPSPNASSQASLTVMAHLQAMGRNFSREWPRVADPEDWHTEFSNTHEELAQEFTSELWGPIEKRGIDFARAGVWEWRQRYALWVELVGEKLEELSPLDANYRAVETIHFVGTRVLGHVDVILAW